jgi:hypothetical protein
MRVVEMLTSKIHQDEFILGYFGRIRILNLFPSIKWLKDVLLDDVHFSGASLADYPVVNAITRMADIPVQQFVLNHSLLPLHLSFPRKNGNVNHGDPSRLDLIEYFGTMVWQKSEAGFCLDCVKEDTEQLGYTYWRRSHQLPGIHGCLKHGAQLAYNSNRKNAFDNVPSDVVECYYKFSEQEFKEISENPIIKRYSDVLNELLSSDRPMHFISVQHRFEKLFRKHKFLGSHHWSETGEFLSDWILDRIPSFWASAQYPVINYRSDPWAFNAIDSVGSGTSNSQVYALVLAALFDSSDEAINYWYSRIRVLVPHPNAKRHDGWEYYRH